MEKFELDWLRDMHKTDTKTPTACVAGEPVYTVYMADFFKMPDVNFFDLAVMDQHVRALLN